MIEFKGKTAVVTGSSRGIGKAIADKLADLGANVVLNGREPDNLAKVEKEFEDKGYNVISFPGAVDNERDVERMVNGTLDKFGDISILINNAGITRDGLTLRMKENDWDEVMSVNLKGTFLCTKAITRHMSKKRYGRIVNISSVIGCIGNIGQANYAASKAGIIGFSKSIAREFARKNITCNVVAPGFIETDMTNKLGEEVKSTYLDRIPLGVFGTVQDVTHAVIFLASDKASYITGQVLRVDGGMVMY